MAITAENSILIVDDDEDAGQNLGDILTDMGYQVGIATNGFSALELARTRKFEIALLDFKMPGMDGLTLARKLKELSCTMVVILTTAYANRETIAAAPEHGIWRVFSKPLDLQRMLPCLLELSQHPFVMLIEDDAEMCRSMTDVLQDQGYRVCFATDLESAMICLRDAAFEVIFIDMMLPGIFGDEVYQQVRSVNADARVVMVTGHRHEMEERIRRSLDAGADAVCYKPFQFPELLATLRRLTQPSSTNQ
jgi:DNA-binding response OmpR family regulator